MARGPGRTRDGEVSRKAPLDGDVQRLQRLPCQGVGVEVVEYPEIVRDLAAGEGIETESRGLEPEEVPGVGVDDID